MSARFSFLVLEHGKLDNGSRQNEAFAALFCLINLASMYSQFFGGANTSKFGKTY
jgi:hypothetical protein